jgi:hypothetical protein
LKTGPLEAPTALFLVDAGEVCASTAERITASEIGATFFIEDLLSVYDLATRQR